MAFLNSRELRKYEWRSEILINKIKEKTPFETKFTKNSIVKLIYPEKNWEYIIRHGSNYDLTKLFFIDTNDKIFKLTEIVKTEEFGIGIRPTGAGAGRARELKELKLIKTQLEEAKIKEGSATIKIKIGSKYYNVYDAELTPGKEKSDIHFIDIYGNEIVWISHKAGRTERNFQQWGGMSQRFEPDIFKQKETQEVIETIKVRFPNGVPSTITAVRKIESEKIKNMSIYGNKFYTNQFSRQNVTLIAQGNIKLVKTGDHYIISANRIHLNGEKLIGGYDPVFTATYKGDRNDFGIKGTRVVIAPIGGRKITEFI